MANESAAKGYWIGHIDVSNPEGYREYQRLSAKAIAAYDGRFIIRGGRSECVEGELRSRHVVIEFPSYDAAVECYRSPSYDAARRIRQANSSGEILIIEGYDPPR